MVVAEFNPETGEAVAARLRGDGAEAIFVATDVADRASVTAMAAAAEAAFGPADILVNNAGINVAREPLELTDEDWRRCFAVDLDGVWHFCRAVLPQMLTKGCGSIVNIASVHSFTIIPHFFPYPVAKHALLGLTRALGIEYARGVRVNAIAPGYIQTRSARPGGRPSPTPRPKSVAPMTCTRPAGSGGPRRWR